jgi:predicted DNA-binding protein (UPF0251 family)
MSRPKKARCINCCPIANHFRPTGLRKSSACPVNLETDELEVIKLIDVDGLDQEGTAQKMQVSRVTVQRIYKTARQKIADALINGKIINIRKE